MSKHCWLLHLEKDSWRLLSDIEDHCQERTIFVPSELLAQVPLIAEKIKAEGYLSEPLVVGLGSTWCLTATVPVASPQLLRKREAMRYHLEQWIPWTAEEYVIDYVGNQHEAFMVATEIGQGKGTGVVLLTNSFGHDRF